MKINKDVVKIGNRKLVLNGVYIIIIKRVMLFLISCKYEILFF